MKTGQRFVVTTGRYDDYDIEATIVALRDFSFDALFETWLRVSCPDTGDYDMHGSQKPRQMPAEPRVFLGWLVLGGYVAEEPTNEVFIYRWGDASEDPAGDRSDEPKET